MLQVSATQAKANMAELLRRAEFGETVAITRHGVPIAHLVPASDAEANARKRAIAQIRDWRRKAQPTGISSSEIRGLIQEGRRW